MRGAYCWLCNSLEGHAESVEKIVFENEAMVEVREEAELDPLESDMELEGNDLSVSVVDGAIRYVAHFPANYCPCCGREL